MGSEQKHRPPGGQRKWRTSLRSGRKVRQGPGSPRHSPATSGTFVLHHLYPVVSYRRRCFPLGFERWNNLALGHSQNETRPAGSSLSRRLGLLDIGAFANGWRSLLDRCGVVVRIRDQIGRHTVRGVLPSIGGPFGGDFGTEVVEQQPAHCGVGIPRFHGAALGHSQIRQPGLCHGIGSGTGRDAGMHEFFVVAAVFVPVDPGGLRLRLFSPATRTYRFAEIDLCGRKQQAETARGTGDRAEQLRPRTAPGCQVAPFRARVGIVLFQQRPLPLQRERSRRRAPGVGSAERLHAAQQIRGSGEPVGGVPQATTDTDPRRGIRIHGQLQPEQHDLDRSQGGCARLSDRGGDTETNTEGSPHQRYQHGGDGTGWKALVGEFRRHDFGLGPATGRPRGWRCSQGHGRTRRHG
mmetsp:Transcript_4159/g.11927  ORF Transcript_4159/g.11927 Transcript_4159/m.11927 type:complete len:408 (+) Transcript_4159:2807-4030(+)